MVNVSPNPGRSSLQSQLAVGRQAEPEWRSGHRGWAGWGRSRGFASASPRWRWRPGTAPDSSRRHAYSSDLEPLADKTKHNPLSSRFTHSHMAVIMLFTAPSYRRDPTLRWRCSRWYPPPASSGPETSPHTSRSQTSAHISGHQRGTSAHRCDRCSWRSLSRCETWRDWDRSQKHGLDIYRASPAGGRESNRNRWEWYLEHWWKA